jgi:hypothetical protein
MIWEFLFIDSMLSWIFPHTPKLCPWGWLQILYFPLNQGLKISLQYPFHLLQGLFVDHYVQKLMHNYR